MKTALLCEQWSLPFNIELKNESNSDLHSRSYIHYVSQHIPLVAAKCWATKWMLEGVLDDSERYNVREYFAGVGIMSTIIRGLYNVNHHVVSEIDHDCVKQLSSMGLDARHEDAKAAMMLDDTSDMKFLDLPNSSVLQITTKWNDCFNKAFESSPKLVAWTDTSVTYPIAVHGEKYSKILGERLTDKYDYVKAYSKWLYSNHRYSIIKAAFRARNAVYLVALPGLHETEFKHFDLATTADGFYFLEKDIGPLDAFT